MSPPLLPKFPLKILRPWTVDAESLRSNGTISHWQPASSSLISALFPAPPDKVGNGRETQAIQMQDLESQSNLVQRPIYSNSN